MSSKMSSTMNSAAKLRSQVVCPHCWFKFPPEDIKWVSAHPDLTNDPRLGTDAQFRFHPTRFNVLGKAIDSKDTACRDLACPKCHLIVAHDLLHMEPLFMSIVGAPASGKSYFLAAMTWQLRNTLRDRFDLSFGDADPTANLLLGGYEELLFLNPNKDQLTSLPKTEAEQGKFFQSVKLDGRPVLFPRPFVFSLEPTDKHPAHGASRNIARALCLYDNAGEHFMPGQESFSGTETRHLSSSKAVLFLFDPTQHVHFRDACPEHEGEGGVDPQMKNHGWNHRQDNLLDVVTKRIQSDGQIGQNKKDNRPLIVVVTKYDAWKSLLGDKTLDIDWVVRKMPGGGAALDIGMLKAVSGHVRELMVKYAAEVVAAAEGFSSNVLYVPVSALGTHSEVNPDTGGLGVRPRNIKPQWAEIPMLYALHCTTNGLIRVGESQGAHNPFEGKPSESNASRTTLASPPTPTPPAVPPASPEVKPPAAGAIDIEAAPPEMTPPEMTPPEMTPPEMTPMRETPMQRKNMKETGS